MLTVRMRIFGQLICLFCIFFGVSCRNELSFDSDLNRYIGSSIHSKGIDLISAIYLIQMDSFEFINDLSEVERRGLRVSRDQHDAVNAAIMDGRLQPQDFVSYNLDLSADIPFRTPDFYVLVFINESAKAFTQIKLACDSTSEICLFEYLGVDQPQYFNNELPAVIKRASGGANAKK